MDPRILYGVIGNLTAFMTFFAPLRLLFKIVEGRSMERYSAVPYHAAFINSAMWVTYFAVHRDIFLMVYVVGVFMELFYLLMFVLWSAHSLLDPSMVKHYLAVNAGICCPYGLYRLALRFDHPDRFSGSISAVGSILACVVKLVYETKRGEERVPFLTSLASLANAVSWSVYGFIVSDMFIMVPNVVGILLYLVQLVHASKFRSPLLQIAEEMGSLSIILFEPDLVLLEPQFL